MADLHRFDNGLILCTERLEGVASVGVHVLLPGGSAFDHDEDDGIAALHGELLLRGAGTLDSRALSDAFDRCGLQRGVSVGTQHLHLHGTTTGARLEEALDLLLTVLRTPRMPQADLPAATNLCLQSIASLADDPAEEAVVQLHTLHRPRPMHRSGLGNAAVLPTLSALDLDTAWSARIGPRGTVIALAGHIDVDAAIHRIAAGIEDWTGPHTPPQVNPQDGPRGRQHLSRATNQTHIALAWDAPKATDEDADAARLASSVLGGGSSSRLFTQVRQRRSLCYSIGSSWQGSAVDGFLQVVTGTTPERAAQTLETTLQTVQDAAEGLFDDEIARARMQYRSGLVRSGESTSARAAALASDAAVLGRVRGLAQRVSQIESVAPDAIRRVAASWAALEPTIVSVGPEDACPW